jgi:hypothetical protein
VTKIVRSPRIASPSKMCEIKQITSYFGASVSQLKKKKKKMRSLDQVISMLSALFIYLFIYFLVLDIELWASKHSYHLNHTLSSGF